MSKQSEHYENILDNPEAWYNAIRGAVRNHQEINKSGYLNEPGRTDKEREDHFIAGMLLGFDVTAAADAYIAHLKGSVMSGHRESVRYAPSGMVAQLPSEVPWERLRTVTLTFTERE